MSPVSFVIRTSYARDRRHIFAALDQICQPEHVQHPNGQFRRRSQCEPAAAAIQQRLTLSKDAGSGAIEELRLGEVDDDVGIT